MKSSYRNSHKNYDIIFLGLVIICISLYFLVQKKSNIAVISGFTERKDTPLPGGSWKLSSKDPKINCDKSGQCFLSALLERNSYHIHRINGKWERTKINDDYVSSTIKFIPGSGVKFENINGQFRKEIPQNYVKYIMEPPPMPHYLMKFPHMELPPEPTFPHMDDLK